MKLNCSNSKHTTARLRKVSAILLITLLNLLAGCGQQKTDSGSSSAEEPNTGSGSKSAASSTDIFTAILENDISAVQQKIDAGEDLNQKEPGGATPLMVAASQGHSDIVSALIKGGADIELKSNDQGTPLMTATFFCHPDVVKILLEAGADMNVPDGNGTVPLTLATTPWGPELEGVYQFVYGLFQMELDIDRIKTDRVKVAAILQENSK